MRFFYSSLSTIFIYKLKGIIIIIVVVFMGGVLSCISIPSPLQCAQQKALPKMKKKSAQNIGIISSFNKVIFFAQKK